MRRILIINTKGGCGKTTIATNVASTYARAGFNVVLHDYDPQGSSMYWLKQRPKSLPRIHGANIHEANTQGITSAWHMRIPPETERVIIDAPPGLRQADLRDLINTADSILVPVLPSPLDIKSTAVFIRDLLLVGKVRSQHIPVGIVPNRTRKHTLAFQALERFLSALNIPVVGTLRDSQNYLKTMEKGFGIADLSPSMGKDDIEVWNEVHDWLERNYRPNLGDVETSRPQRSVRPQQLLR